MFRHFLEQFASFQKENQLKMGFSFPYSSMHEFILTHGREMKASKHGMRIGTPQQCFGNSARACQDNPSLTYYEGFVLVHIPIHHAWCVDASGKVIDLTIPNAEGKDYFGVGFQTEYVLSRVEKTMTWASMLDNFKESHPLLRGIHSIEESLEVHRPKI